MSSISVLTLLKGRHDHLHHLIEGLSRSLEPPGELIVVNMDSAPLSLPRQPFAVRVIDLPSAGALPLGAARNRAAAAAQHRLLCFLDVDCIVSARSLTALRQGFARQDCMLCPEVLYLPAGEPTPGWREDVLRRRGVAHPVRNFPVHGQLREFNPGFLWGVAFAFRASTFYRLGGFDEQFTGYGAEDTDLGFNANAHGLPLIYQAGAPIFHQHHTLYEPPLQHFADIVRNAVLFHGKWGIWPMQERLDAFVAAGLLERSETGLRIIRYPTDEEVAAARQSDDVMF
jgi:GT2 family glycosyltransferase